MAVPSRKKAVARSRKGRSVKSFLFKKKNFQRPLVLCENCKKNKQLHFICLFCKKNPTETE